MTTRMMIMRRITKLVRILTKAMSLNMVWKITGLELMDGDKDNKSNTTSMSMGRKIILLIHLQQ